VPPSSINYAELVEALAPMKPCSFFGEIGDIRPAPIREQAQQSGKTVRQSDARIACDGITMTQS